MGIDQFRYQNSLLERQGRCFQSTGYGAFKGIETEDEPHRPTGLVGNACGRVDAPLLFYKELTKHLHELNFRTHPLEPCIFILESGVGEKRILHGILGTHVDDGIGAGDAYFHKQLQKLEKRLPFGSLKYGN